MREKGLQLDEMSHTLHAKSDESRGLTIQRIFLHQSSLPSKSHCRYQNHAIQSGLIKEKQLLGPQRETADTTVSRTHREALTPINNLFFVQPSHAVKYLHRTNTPMLHIA